MYASSRSEYKGKAILPATRILAGTLKGKTEESQDYERRLRV